jgi:hypothetical protein
MGLLGVLVGLPLAPLRGLAAVARQLQVQAAQQRERDIAQLQAELLELQLRYEQGEVLEEDLVVKETELLEKVGVLVRAGGPGDRR